ncbi:hypothetical protein SeMB42_g06560 [Synchytrium endobioticum]|nr:hypothetical protein SeMB42_g06560 [Synchytrium endobioticum]
MVLTSLDPGFPDQKTRGHIRFVAISDTHTQHGALEMPDGDVLLHCGDFTYEGLESEITDFMAWITALPYKYKIFIPGNHDLTLDVPFYKQHAHRFHRHGEVLDPVVLAEKCRRLVHGPRDRGVVYLQDAKFEVPGTGIRIYGMPWMPDFHQWAFMADRKSQTLKGGSHPARY